MATAKASQAHDSANWFHAQKNIFDEQVKAGEKLRGQWTEFLGEWQKHVSGKADPEKSVPGTEAFRQFFAQAGQQYLDILQKFQAGAGQGKAPEDTLKEWVAGLWQYFQPMESMVKAGQAFAASLRDGGPFAQNPQGLGAFDPFGFFASMPGIGYTREKQDKLGELYRRWAAFEKSTNKYNASMAKVGFEAASKFQAYVLNPPMGAAPLTSLKSVYVKWVDVCEEIYAKYAVSEEYTRNYGETVNALMSFKAQLNQLTDDAVSEFNLPTRQEIDSLHERQHTLRRENIQLKKDVAELRKAVFKAASPKPQVKIVKKAAKRKKK